MTTADLQKQIAAQQFDVRRCSATKFLDDDFEEEVQVASLADTAEKTKYSANDSFSMMHIPINDISLPPTKMIVVD